MDYHLNDHPRFEIIVVEESYGIRLIGFMFQFLPGTPLTEVYLILKPDFLN